MRYKRDTKDNRMHWAFVDYENVGSLEALNISEYEKVFVFCGPRNTRIKFGSIPAHEFCSIELIQVATMGDNNLDFHIAFHMGRFHEMAEKNVAFHIVSNDAGFNGLVNHLKKMGRLCKKILTNKTLVEQNSSSELSESASFVLDKLKGLDGRKRPRTRPKLISWIKNQCQGKENSPEPAAICEELIKTHLVRESESSVTYELGR
jgi:hypothetical protein